MLKPPSLQHISGLEPVQKPQVTLGPDVKLEKEDPPVTPQPEIKTKEDNMIILKTTSEQPVLKPTSLQHRPGLESTKKPPANKSK